MLVPSVVGLARTAEKTETAATAPIPTKLSGPAARSAGATATCGATAAAAAATAPVTSTNLFKPAHLASFSAAMISSCKVQYFLMLDSDRIVCKASHRRSPLASTCST